MNDSYPPGCREQDIPGNSDEDVRYEHWVVDNEDMFLEWFMEKFPDAPPVKDWNETWTKAWDEFLAHQWDMEANRW